MFDFNAARETMLDSQIRPSDVTDIKLQSAFRKIPREKFVPKARMALAYGDANIELGGGRWMLKPRDFAKMVDAADVQSDDIVLNIACGRGYSVAILAQLAETVVGLEVDAELVKKATERLDHCETTNAAVVQGDLKAGAVEHGPFNIIFVNGGVSCVSKHWFEQLANGGRLVVPVVDGPICRVKIYTKSGDSIGERIVFDAGVPLLPGFEREDAFAL